MRCQKKLTNGKICRNKLNHDDNISSINVDKSNNDLNNNINKYFCNKHYISPLNIEELKCCCICMKENLEFKEIIFLECNHIFHKPCLINWFKKANNFNNCDSNHYDFINNCILCRNKINNNKFLENIILKNNKDNDYENKTLLYKIFPDLYKNYKIKNKSDNFIEYNLFYDIHG